MIHPWICSRSPDMKERKNSLNYIEKVLLRILHTPWSPLTPADDQCCLSGLFYPAIQLTLSPRDTWEKWDQSFAGTFRLCRYVLHQNPNKKDFLFQIWTITRRTAKDKWLAQKIEVEFLSGNIFQTPLGLTEGRNDYELSQITQKMLWQNSAVIASLLEGNYKEWSNSIVREV